MEEDVAEDLSGEFRLLMISVINAGRDEGDEIDTDKVKEDAQVRMSLFCYHNVLEEQFTPSDLHNLSTMQTVRKHTSQALYDAGPGQLGTKEEVYQAIFNSRSSAHMREVFDAYEEVSEGTTIEDTISSEFSGSVKVAYLAMSEYTVHCIILSDKVMEIIDLFQLWNSQSIPQPCCL